MIAVAIKGLASRKLRALLTGTAIVLGVAMVSGTFVLTDTISKSFDALFAENYEGTSAVVTGRDPDVERRGVHTAPPPIDAALLERVRELPEVAAAAGAITDFAKVVGRDGQVVETARAPTYAYGYDFDKPRFVPLELERGRFPSGPRQVALDRETAVGEGLEVGDSVEVVTRGPARRFRITGLARYKSVSSIGGAIFVVFDLSTVQELLGLEGKLGSISAAARSGLSPERLVQAIEPILPASAVVRTAAAQAEQAQDDQGTDALTNLLRQFLLAFGGIALFVGAFVIFNTLSITVAQRTRELATLRTLGATPRQVLWSVVLEALVLGAVASVVGLFTGVALAGALEGLLTAFEIDLPDTETVLGARTVVVSLVVGLLVTLLAGLAPGLRSARVPPILAVREGSTLPPSRLAGVAPYLSLAAAVAAVALLLAALVVLDDLATAQQLTLVVVGCVLLFVAVAGVSPRIIGWLAVVVGWPAARVGGAPGELARHNARRNPARVAVTAAALMVGIALVTFVAVVGAAMRSANENAIERQLDADYVVSAEAGEAFDSDAARAIEAVPGVAAASSVRADSARRQGSSASSKVTGIDPRSIASTYRFDWADGSDEVLRDLGPQQAVVSEDFAKAEELERGDGFRMVTPLGETVQLEVAAIHRPRPLAPLLGDVTVSEQTYDRAFERAKTQYTFVRLPEERAPAVEALERALAPFPDAKLETKARFIDGQGEMLAALLNLVFLLLALAVVVSLFGIVNTLALSVLERTREIGMLRAVGLVRRQVRAMVLYESVIIALIGGVLGVAAGLFLGAVVSQALGDYDLSFQVPAGYLAAFLLITLVAVAFASILPARRAARQDVLATLQYE